MSVPIKVTKTGNDTTGLAEFSDAESIAVDDGGTGAVTASQARVNLGVEIGVDVAAYDGTLEIGATGDQTDVEIKAAYENNADTNVFTDVEKQVVVDINMTAAKVLAALDIADMQYDLGTGDLVKIIYSGTNNFEDLTYSADGLSNVAHTIDNVLIGNTALSYTSGSLTSAIYTVV